MSGVKSVEFGGPKTDFLNQLVETCTDSGFDLRVQVDAVVQLMADVVVAGDFNLEEVVANLRIAVGMERRRRGEEPADAPV